MALNFPNSPTPNQLYKDPETNTDYIYVVDPQSPTGVGKWRAAYLGDSFDIRQAILDEIGLLNLDIAEIQDTANEALAAAEAALAAAEEALDLANSVSGTADSAQLAAANALAIANDALDATSALSTQLAGKVNRVGDTFTGNVTIPNLTVSDLASAARFAGRGALPVGTIIMWNGGSIPTGWAVCNGANGTPDLRNRFVVATGSQYALGATGGSAQVTLGASQMPAHTHGVNAGRSTDNINGGPFVKRIEYLDPSGGEGNYTSPGSAWSTTSAGGNASHENRPPYYALIFIMRIS